jgi:hypothetical protein
MRNLPAVPKGNGKKCFTTKILSYFHKKIVVLPQKFFSKFCRNKKNFHKKFVKTQKFCCTHTKILLYSHKKFVVLPAKNNVLAQKIFIKKINFKSKLCTKNSIKLNFKKAFF